MSDNIENTLNAIQTAFTELKNTNEQKLAEMATKGSVDTLIDTKISAINDTITEMQAKMQRPAVGETDQAEDEYKSAFNHWARKGTGGADLEAKSITLTAGANADAANAAGGILLPRTIEAGINRELETLSEIRSRATVISVSGPDYRYLNASDDFGSGWVGEVDDRPETSTGTFRETKVPMGEIYAYPHASQWALDDTAFDLDVYIVDETARAFAKRENAAFVNGDGLNKPRGILADAADFKSVKSGVAFNNTTGAGLPTSGDAYLQMIYALPAAYRQNAAFILGSSSELSIRTLKDANGNYIWQPSLVANAPQTLGGYAMITVEEMPGVAANSTSVLFGDLSHYLIVDRKGLTTIRDSLTKKPFVGFYSTKRVGGMVKDKKAFVVLKTAA